MSEQKELDLPWEPSFLREKIVEPELLALGYLYIFYRRESPELKFQGRPILRYLEAQNARLQKVRKILLEEEDSLIFEAADKQ